MAVRRAGGKLTMERAEIIEEDGSVILAATREVLVWKIKFWPFFAVKWLRSS